MQTSGKFSSVSATFRIRFVLRLQSLQILGLFYFCCLQWLHSSIFILLSQMFGGFYYGRRILYLYLLTCQKYKYKCFRPAVDELLSYARETLSCNFYLPFFFFHFPSLEIWCLDSYENRYLSSLSLNSLFIFYWLIIPAYSHKNINNGWFLLSPGSRITIPLHLQFFPIPSRAFHPSNIVPPRQC